jgi:UDP-glucose 4-epimerase
MKCIVFGGEGFIGSHLVDRLVSSGHEVTVFDRRCNPLVPRRPEARYIRGDFADVSSVEDVLAGAEGVFHLVGTTVPQTSNDDLAFDLKTNVLWTIGFLQACARSGVGKVIFLSSGGTVYGVPQEVPIPETHPTDPICSYGITKLIVEKYLRLFHHLHGLEYTILRCANAYGERQDPSGKQGAIAVFLGHLARKEPIVIWGEGGVVRDHIFVSDIARALEMAAMARIEDRIFNIGSGVGVSLKQLLQIVQEVTGRTPLVEHRERRAFDVPLNVLDITLARRSLGWEPEFDLSAGLERTWEWVQRWAATSGHAWPEAQGRMQPGVNRLP